MAKHPGDSGNWDVGSAAEPRCSIRERINTGMSVTSPEVLKAMKEEDTFLASIKGTPDTKRFTDRRKIPGRDRLIS